MADIVRKNPSEFLKTLIGRPVVVRLNSGVDYRGSFLFSYFFFLFLFPFSFSILQSFLYSGVLACLDGFMNIALDQTEEYVNGQLKNKYGDAFIRGNNGQTRCLSFLTSCLF